MKNSQTRILTIFTRTPLHVGAGSSIGAIDQPVQRERHTGFPIIPGSSIKGVLRARFSSIWVEGETGEVFGRGTESETFTAGQVSFGEARLLCFPVRSAKGSFALTTSPLALSRFARDAELEFPVPEQPVDMTCLSSPTCTMEKNKHKGIVLEEYRFNSVGVFPEVWANYLSTLLDDAVLSGAKDRFVLLSDGDMGHFAVNACQVNQHVRIDDQTGTAEKGGLFNEETVPSETLFYSAITPLKQSDGVTALLDNLATEQLIQFGGDGTTGLGFCTIKINSNKG